MALNFCNNNSLSAITSIPTSITGGNLTLISTSTISSSTAAIEITSGLDSTYKEYIFKFYNLHPVNDGTSWQFQGSTNGGTSYGVNKLSTFVEAEHDEGDSSVAFQYNTGFDRGANSTDYITLVGEIGNDNDQSASGFLHLFNPSDTTFVKHYIARTSQSSNADLARDQFIGGFFNTTSAIDALKFEMRVGNIETAVLKMYGVS